MASYTPKKTIAFKIVPEIELCVACSSNSKQRYYILKKNGEKGPSYEIASNFYGFQFNCSDNWGSYLCKTCNRIQSRVIDSRENVRNMCEKLLSTTQSFRERNSEKRLLVRTPNHREKLTKRQTFQIPVPPPVYIQETPFNNLGRHHSTSTNTHVPVCTEDSIQPKHDRPSPSKIPRPQLTPIKTPQKQKENSVHDFFSSVKLSATKMTPSQKLKDEYTSMIISPSKIPRPKQTVKRSRVSLFQSNSVHTCIKKEEKKEDTNAKSRTVQLKFRSTHWKNSLTPVLNKLCNGSVRSALMLLLQNKSDHIKDQAVLGLQAVIERECSQLIKNVNSQMKIKHNDLQSFGVKNLQKEYQSGIPIAWSVLQTMAKSKKGMSDDAKMTTACAILFHSRNFNLNAFQHCIGISLYNNQLQKEGFMIMSKLGITTSHVTLNNTLNKVKQKVDEVMSDLKKDLEKPSDIVDKCDNGLGQNSDNETIAMDVIHLDHGYVNPCDSKNSEVDLDKNEQKFAYRFNLDNLDFMIRVRNMTQDHQNESKHYVQLMAIKDRVYCKHLRNDLPIGNLLEVPNSDFLPNGDDISSLREDFIHVVAEILVENVQAFQVFRRACDYKMHHQFSEEMKKKSVVLPLGILAKNENKTNDMIEILNYLQKYVPNARTADDIDEEIRDETAADMRPIPVGGDQLTCERIRGAHMATLDGDSPEERLEGVFCMVEDFHEKMIFLQNPVKYGLQNKSSLLQSINFSTIPVGGDQLTCERIRGAHMATLDGDSPEERLEGVFCMVEDFHEKMIFLQVILDKFFKMESCREEGTLSQLKNLLNRRNVTKTASNSYHANGEFIDLVTECHVITACLEYCGMENVESHCSKIPKGIHIADNIMKKKGAVSDS